MLYDHCSSTRLNCARIYNQHVNLIFVVERPLHQAVTNFVGATYIPPRNQCTCFCFEMFSIFLPDIQVTNYLTHLHTIASHVDGIQFACIKLLVFRASLGQSNSSRHGQLLFKECAYIKYIHWLVYWNPIRRVMNRSHSNQVGKQANTEIHDWIEKCMYNLVTDCRQISGTLQDFKPVFSAINQAAL